MQMGVLRTVFDRFRYAPLVWFTIAFCSLAGYLYLPEILFAGPRGIHFIRQTDSLSFASVYYLFGNPFWEPGILDLNTAPDNGASAGEFPILYYLTAMCYHLFGKHYFFLKSMNLGCVIIGHVLLARACMPWLGSALRALMFSLWMFSSSVVIYYACNYLPDAAAYGLILSGWSLFWIHRQTSPRKALAWAIALFTLAGLLKVTTSMHLIAFMLMVFIQPGGSNAWREHVKANRTKISCWVLVGLLLVGAWQLYAIRYNALHHSRYFLTWTEPLWNMHPEVVSETWTAMTQYWWSGYHHPTTWHVLLIMVIVLLPLSRHVDRELITLAAVLIVAGLGYAVLFFNKFRDHDYYFLTIAPALIVLALTTLVALHRRTTDRVVSLGTTIGLGAMTVAGLSFGDLNLSRRHHTLPDQFNKAATLIADIDESTLSSIPISRHDKIIVVGDRTPCGVLLHLDRMGWAIQETPPPSTTTLSAALLGAQYALCIDATPVPEWLSGDTILKKPHWSVIRLRSQATHGAGFDPDTEVPGDTSPVQHLGK